MTTSVLGLGAMGSGMALNLQRHGMLTAAWNRTRKRVEDWAAREQIPLVDEISHAVGQALRLDMQQVIEVISGGAAGNWFLDHRGRSILENRFEPGFKLALHHKDLQICRGMAAAKGVQSPLLELTLTDYQALLAEGHREEDISTLFHLKQRLYE
jgi:3-hydroxyisobutyrate dehydrogenase-like beta-hydroxyacid dehydrogenase